MSKKETLDKIKTALNKKLLTPSAAHNLKNWLARDDAREYWDELRDMVNDEKYPLLNDSFDHIIPFGTGGRRGPLGIGTNRINLITISESVQGVANYLKRKMPDNPSLKAVVAYDTRHFSKEFANRAAEVLVGNGFLVFLFEEFRSTPELSFAVRFLKADIGFVISASHNPPTDNGIKVYWHNGGQIIHPHDEKIIEEVQLLVGQEKPEIKSLNLIEAQKRGKIEFIGKEIDKQYINAVCQERLISSKGADIQIVYTPLHGAGTTNVLAVLNNLGYAVHLVDEQAAPNGSFPAVPNNIPNPEDPAALALAIERARSLNADLALATDPDADRLGVAVPTTPQKTQWEPLTGNQIASLLTYFVLDQLKKKNELRKDSLVVRTIVTTNMVDCICRDFGVEVKSDLPVGFKFIAEVINRLEKEGAGNRFILGAEESYGFLKGAYTRDKDAAVAAVLMAELTAIMKMEGKTPYQLLQELYIKYGYHSDIVDSLVLEGTEGMREMEAFMEEFRYNISEGQRIGSELILRKRDCLEQAVLDPSLHSRDANNLLIFELSDDGKTRISVRPSGTEPKLKYYISIYSGILSTIQEGDLSPIKQLVDHIAIGIIADLELRFRNQVQNMLLRTLINDRKRKIDLYNELVRNTRRFLFAEAASLFLLNDKHELRLAGVSGYWEGKRDRCLYELHENYLTPWIARNPGKFVKLDSSDELHSHPAYSGKTQKGKYDNLIWPKAGKCNSFLGTALIGQEGNVIGVLKVENKRPRIGKGSAFTNEDLALFKYICNIIVLAISKM
jgi:phosphomannomutase